MRLAVLAIARETFDVAFAQDTARAAVTNLRTHGHEIVGSPQLCMDSEAVARGIESLIAHRSDALVLLQASFTDSTLPVAAAEGVDGPVVLWAFPEERAGGRLRLNSFCGVNLAGYTLSRIGRRYAWVHLPADHDEASAAIASAVARGPVAESVACEPDVDGLPSDVVARAKGVVDRLRTTVIGRVGDRPVGFEPCAYEADALRSVLGVEVDEVPLPDLFTRSWHASSDDVARLHADAAEFLAGIDDVDQAALTRSLALGVGIAGLVSDRAWSGAAVRCWPEVFTELGGAACAPMGMLAAEGTPGSCEADVYGNITALVLRWLGGSASFVADLVDLDSATNTGVFWHCGLAPFDMADPEATPVATVHSNRDKPLVSEFPLKPGRITIARFSQSRGEHSLVVGAADMLRAPLAFRGTAGVVHFDTTVDEVRDTILGQGLEHHYGIVYGDVTDELRVVASLVGIPVVELGRRR